MAFNLMDAVQKQLGDAFGKQVSELIGESSDKTTNAISSAIPELIGGLIQSNSDGSGIKNLQGTLNNLDDDILDQVPAKLSSGGHFSLVEMGMNLLQTVLGNNIITKVLGAVAGASGIGKGPAKSLLGLLAPVILGMIKKKMSSDNLDANGLSDLLMSQKDHIKSSLVTDVTENEPAAEVVAQPKRTINERKPASRIGHLLWIPMFAIIGWLGYDFLKNKLPPDEAMNAPTASFEQPAIDQIENIEPAAPSPGITDAAADLGNIDVSGELNSVFDSTSTAMTNISDIESAKAAIPQISAATSKLDQLSGVYQNLPDAAKSVVSNAAGGKISGLQGMVDKLSAIPGVGSVLKPTTDALLDKLALFTGA
ncbi:MAG: DUF937 domain-containing protein [Methylococcaceae bacterium]